MKQNRNDLCQCGSGKKYKKCCGLFDCDDVESDDEDIYRKLQTSFAKLNMMILMKKPHIKKYKKIRRIDDEIANAMVDYYIDGKFVSPIQALLDKNFDEDTDEGWQAIINFVVYKNSVDLNCIADEFIKKNRYKQPEKIEYLNSIANSRMGLYEVTRKDPDEGYAYMKNVISGEEIKVIDIALSTDHIEKEKYYYHARIVNYQGINFNANTDMFFKLSDNYIKKYIAKCKEKYNPDLEFGSYLQLYNRYMNDPNRAMINRFNVVE